MARSTYFSSLELPKSALSYAEIFIRLKKKEEKKEEEKEKLADYYCYQEDKNVWPNHTGN